MKRSLLLTGIVVVALFTSVARGAAPAFLGMESVADDGTIVWDGSASVATSTSRGVLGTTAGPYTAAGQVDPADLVVALTLTGVPTTQVDNIGIIISNLNGACAGCASLRTALTSLGLLLPDQINPSADLDTPVVAFYAPLFGPKTAVNGDVFRLSTNDVARLRNVLSTPGFSAGQLVNGVSVNSTRTAGTFGYVGTQIFTVTAVPAPFGKVSPPAGTTGVPTPPPLTWASSRSASGYEYCIDVINNNSCDNAWIPVGLATSASPALNTGTPYFWQARAVNPVVRTEADSGAWWRLTTAPTLPAYPHDRGDLTLDGKPDLVWQDPTSGALLLWEMNGSAYAGYDFLSSGGTLWQIVGVGDFTGDGKTDLVWQHPTTGAVLLWQMDGATYAGGTFINTGGTLWKVVGVGDMTGDGKPDIVWQYPSTGAVLLWEVNGTSLVSGTILNSGGTLWKVVGVADFSGDGKADLIWQHPTTGAVLLWQMNGATFVTGSFINTGGTLWKVVGNGDYTGDGKPDLLWQLPSTGAVLLWQMNGPTYVQGTILNSGGTLWKVKGPR